jgi:hypothetical protein
MQAGNAGAMEQQRFRHAGVLPIDQTVTGP